MPAKPNPVGDGLTANPNGEGVYPMVDSQGQTVQIPYSNVQHAAAMGHRFQTKDALQQYARDHAAGPVDEDAADKYIDGLSWYNPVKLGRDVLSGLGAGALKTATGLDKAPQGHGAGGRVEQDMQIAAATPAKGVAGAVGELGENVGEWFSGEELLGMLGKAGEAMNLSEKMKALTGLSQTIEKYPLVGKLLKIGSGAVKQGSIGAGQTYAKTGSPSAAAESGVATAVAGPLLEGAAGKMAGRAAVAAKPGAAEYAAEARGAIEPQLREVEGAINGQAAGAAPAATAGGTALIPRTAVEVAQGKAAAQAAAKATSALDVNGVLNTVHDFNGAKDRLVQVADPMYSAIDQAAGGKFRPLNAEVTAAQKGVWKTVAGTPEWAAAEKLYENKLNQMSDLIDSTKGTVTPEIVQAAKGAFRQSYLLDDFATIWDKNLEGVPGNTKVSSAQRGVNGKGLMRDLTSAVNKKGRPAIEAALGPGRLDNLEAIARANDTIPKKVAFTQAVRNVAKEMEKGAVLGGVVGQATGAGFGVGGTVGAGLMGATYLPDVLRAVAANPRIGRSLTFAIEAGARPEVYGPMISRMVQADHESAERDRQAQAEADEPVPKNSGDSPIRTIPVQDANVQEVAKRFPALGRYLGQVVIQSGTNEKGDDRQVETYAPWETDNPNKGKITIQPFRPELTSGANLTNTVASELLHHIGGTDPSTGRSVDPQYQTLKQAVIQARTPHQQQVDQHEYAVQRKEGDTRSFNDWINQSRADEYIMGYVTPDAADEWRKNGWYSQPQMHRAVEKIRQYLTEKR
jgi:hypothetical protein